jgi:hypothetical protein
MLPVQKQVRINYITLTNLNNQINGAQKMKKILPILALIAVLAVAGCGGSGDSTGFTSGDALSITIDTEGKTTFDSQEPFYITIDATNDGYFDAENVHARLTGYDGITEIGGSTLSEEVTLTPSTLLAPDDDLGLAGGNGDYTWDVKAPVVREHEPDRYVTLTSEIFYDYTSTATQSMVAVTREYLQKLDDRGESFNIYPEGESLNGPVSVEMLVPDPYVKVIGDDTDFRIKVLLYNDGSGNVYHDALHKYDYLRKVKVTVPAGLKIDKTSCDFDVVGSNDVDTEKVMTIEATGSSQSKMRLLEGGAERVLQCKLMVDKSMVSSGYNTYTFNTEVEYTYVQSIEHDLTFVGTETVPLEAYIVSPVKNDDTQTDRWWFDDNINRPVEFDVLYNGQTVTSGLSADDDDDNYVEMELSGEPVFVQNNLVYADGHWKADVRVPDMGTDENTYDLKVIVHYNEESASDTAIDAILYSEENPLE